MFFKASQFRFRNCLACSWREKMHFLKNVKLYRQKYMAPETCSPRKHRISLSSASKATQYSLDPPTISYALLPLASTDKPFQYCYLWLLPMDGKSSWSCCICHTAWDEGFWRVSPVCFWFASFHHIFLNWRVPSLQLLIINKPRLLLFCSLLLLWERE